MIEVVKLMDICEKITDGSHYSPPEDEDGKYPMLSVKDMRTQGFDYSNSKMISYEEFEKLVKSDCKPLLNDILIAKDGSYLKHVFVISKEREQAVLSSIGILRPDITKVNPHYLKYYLSSSSVKKEVSKKYVSGSALPRIILKAFGQIEVIKKTLPTQKKIAHVLSTLDKKIELNNRINEQLEAMAKLIYDYWFVQFDFPDENGKPYKSSGGKMVYDEVLKREIPKGWEVGNIFECADLVGGGTPSKKIAKYWNGTIPFFTPTDTESSVFCLKTILNTTEIGIEKSSTKLFSKGTIFITARGTVGKINISGTPMAMNQSCYALVPKEGFSSEFIYFHTMMIVKYLKAKSSGSIFKAIVTNDFKFTPSIVPEKKVVAKYSSLVHSSFEKILINLKENQRLSALRDWLLPMLMNGQVTVE